MNFTLTLIGKIINLLVSLIPWLGKRIAYHIFCFPIRRKLKPRQQKFLDDAHQIKVPFNKREIALYGWGEGDKIILFCHGWRSNSFRWKKYIEALDKDRFRVYAMDAPAHGGSTGKTCNIPIYKEAIAEVIKVIGKPYGLVGHSFGCISSLFLFHVSPDLWPEKVVYLASPGRAQDFVNFYQKALRLNEKTMNSLDAYFEQKFGYNIAYYEIENLLNKPKAKGLLIHDKQDKDVDVKYAPKMHALWKETELVLTEGLGHNLKDIKVVEKVGDFLSDKYN